MGEKKPPLSFEKGLIGWDGMGLRKRFFSFFRNQQIRREIVIETS